MNHNACAETDRVDARPSRRIFSLRNCFELTATASSFEVISPRDEVVSAVALWTLVKESEMKVGRPRRGLAAASVGISLISVVGMFPSARAEETVGKWRVEVTLSGVDPGDRIQSQALNTTTIETGESREFVFDPRPDRAAIVDARLSTTTRFDVRASYGFKALKNAELVLDFGVGRYEATIKNLELVYSLDVQDPNLIRSGQRVPTCEVDPLFFGCIAFDNDPSSESIGFERWNWVPVDAGDLDITPISAGIIARFRPTKRWNPYVGGSLGYLDVKFTPSQQWTDFRDQLAVSYVDYVRAADTSSGRELRGKPHRIVPPNVDAPNSVFFEGRGGMEYQIRPNIAFFSAVAFMWAMDDIEITVDGRTKFGNTVPNIRLEAGQPGVPPDGAYPAYIIIGGVRRPVRSGDGGLVGEGPWPGEYFFNGGTLDYGGYSFTLGMKFTVGNKK
jgi:hypothetical protein